MTGPRVERVLVLGGGIGGLSAAHELAERGFDVTVCEARPSLGGKARSFPAHDAELAGLSLPAEHGFRFFPGFYRHVIDTMARTPTARGRSVREHLVATTDSKTFNTKVGWTIPNRPFASIGDLWTGINFAFRALGGADIPSADTRFFAERMFMALSSCDERRFGEYEHTSFWDFMDAKRRSAEYQRYLVEGATKTLVACAARKISARTGGVIGGLLVLEGMRTGAAHVLDGPTNQVWIDPWREHLERLGVKFRFGARVTRLGVTSNRIKSVTVASDGSSQELEADYYVLAVPVEALLPLLDGPVLEAAPALASLHKLQTDWMAGVQFYLDCDLRVNHGHSTYLDSPWALTAVSQTQFWPDYSPAAHGGVRTIFSVCVSNWDAPGVVFDKPARRCTREEIRREVWAQLHAHWPPEVRTAISEHNIVGWNLDPAIRIGPDGTTNDEPLLINTVGSWQHRPEARTEIDNLFLGADYVRTNTDLATMEGANEAARRATNAILSHARRDAASCQVWPLSEPTWLAPLKTLDKLRWEKGLPPQPLFLDEIGRGAGELLSSGADLLRFASTLVGGELMRRGHDQTISRVDWGMRAGLQTLGEAFRRVKDAITQPGASWRGTAEDTSSVASAFARDVLASALPSDDPRVAHLSQAVIRGVAASERMVASAGAPGVGPLVGGAIRQMLLVRGKHIRALCVLLSSSVGRPRFPDEAIAIAGAIELVHSATLMHDDVIDEGDLRRGQPAPRVVYGDPASILGGNALMLKASSVLMEIGRPDLFFALKTAMDGIVAAEGKQLANRGRLLLDEASYFEVIRGKTATLFSWACRAGAVAAGRPEHEIEALARFGEALGIAFQMADDILDVAGDPSVTGKALFGDLREGKATYPLIVAAKRSPEIRQVLERILAEGQDIQGAEVQETLVRLVTAADTLEAARRGTAEMADRAKDILGEVMPGPATVLLRVLTDAAARRNR